MKTPKPRIRELYPVSLGAIIRQYGWRARDNNAIKPDYISPAGRVQRFKEMPSDETVESGVLYCIAKPKTAGWNELFVAGVGRITKNAYYYVTGTRPEMEALVKRFIAKNSSIKLRAETQWLAAELEVMRLETKS
jgi:hypothetical protein